MSSEFFKAVRRKASLTAVTRLCNHAGEVMTDPVGLRHICIAFYGDLYRNTVASPAQDAAVEDILAFIPQRFSQDAQDILDQSMTETE